MPYRVKIITDNRAPSGHRLTTVELEYPRMVHSEFMTHRILSRNAASSRAIPVAKMIEKVMTDPAMPIHWGANRPGMQAYEQLEGEALQRAKSEWLRGRDEAVKTAENLLSIGCHKQIANRPLEPYSWITVVSSCTNYNPVLNLRCHHAAQPEFQYFAWDLAKELYFNEPAEVPAGFWSTPYIQPDEYGTMTQEMLCKISVARCARISYLTQDGIRSHDKDMEMYNRLQYPPSGDFIEDEPLHGSPFEHVAQASDDPELRSGNFQGWDQLRKNIPGENRSEILPFLLEKLEAERKRRESLTQ